MTARRGRGGRDASPDAPAGPAPPARWDDLVVLVGSTVWESTHLADQEIARHLSQHLPVLYVDPPVSRMTARRVAAVAQTLEGPRLRFETPTLARSTPLVLPGKSRPLMHAVTGALLRRHVRETAAVLGEHVRAVITMSPMHRVLGVCHEPLSVHWVKDDYRSGAGLIGQPERRVGRREAAALDAADLVVASSAAIADRLRARGLDPLVIPNGVNAEHYAAVPSTPPAADVRLEGPVAGFIGTLSARIDLGLLEAIAERGTALLLVGAQQHTFRSERFDRLVDRDNVQWVGPRPYAELPAYLAAMDVGLLPYADTDFNRASFPLKVLEYLAAGLGVVAVDLPAARWLGTDLVRIVTAGHDFAAAAAEGARENGSEVVERRQTFARQHSWEERIADFVRAAGLLDADSSARLPGA
jgi:teichuronic acid biosynthesis glycosyltransferase TuaH